MLLLALSAAASAAEEPPPLPLQADNVDAASLKARALAGLEGRDRGMVRFLVRNDVPVNALERRLAHRSVVLVHQDDDAAVWRVLDKRGTADWLRVDTDPDGRIVDWTWLSEGLSASEKLADRAAGGGELQRRRDEVEELVLVAPADLPAELDRLHAAFPGEVWPDLESLEPFWRTEDWAHFEAALDRIEAEAGADPWLEWLHAAAAANDGRKDEAKRRKALAVQFDPSLVRQAYTPGKTRHG
jgi:hypothetical protein